MLTTNEAARALGLSRIAVLKAISRGTLAALKPGRDWMISQEAVDAYRAARLGKRGRPRE